MSPAPISRRAVVAGAGAALGAAALPGGTSAAFDPAAYVRDLRALGCAVYLTPSWRRGGSGRTVYAIASPACLGFGDDFRRAMVRWHPAVTACPNHVGRVVAFLAGEGATT